MSIIGDILDEMWNTTVYYKGIPTNLFGIPRFSRYKKRSLETTLYRLKKQNIIAEKEGAWIFTPHGRKFYVRRREKIFKKFESPFKKDAAKNLLLIFDIPEKQKQERDWFRSQLKMFGYTMIQKSVWLGPSPLPKQFLDYARNIGIEKTFRTFKVSREKKAS